MRIWEKHASQHWTGLYWRVEYRHQSSQQKELLSYTVIPTPPTLILWWWSLFPGQLPQFPTTLSISPKATLSLWDFFFCSECQPKFPPTLPMSLLLPPSSFCPYVGNASYFLGKWPDLSLLHLDGFTSPATLAATTSWMNDWNLFSTNTTSLPSRILSLFQIQNKNPTCTSRRTCLY